jgi:hypothetical protein
MRSRAFYSEVLKHCRTQDQYWSALEEFVSLTATLATLETEREPAELETDERYQQLQRGVAEKRAEVNEILAPGRLDWEFVFKRCQTIPQQNSDM